MGQPCEDTDLMLSIALNSEVHLVPERLVRYRLHGTQSVANEDHLAAQERRLYAKWHELGAAPGGPRELVAEAERFVLRVRLIEGFRAAASSFRAGQVARAARFAGGAVRRYGLPLLLGRNPVATDTR
jgi:hypothetical protein